MRTFMCGSKKLTVAAAMDLGVEQCKVRILQQCFGIRTISGETPMPTLTGRATFPCSWV